MHAERLLYNIRVQSLLLIAQAIFLLAHRQTDTTECHTHVGGCTAGVDYNLLLIL